LLADQALKFWVKTTMCIGEEIHISGNWFILHFTENNGMAFGLQFAGESGKLFLSVFRIIAIGVIGWYLTRIIKQKVHWGLIVSVSLIFAGALGNILDSAVYGLIFDESPRLYHSNNCIPAVFMPEGGGYASFLHGRVVDMLYFPLFSGNYPEWIMGGRRFTFFAPVFNIADSAITTGVFILILFQKRFFSKPEGEDKDELEDDAVLG